MSLYRYSVVGRELTLFFSAVGGKRCKSRISLGVAITLVDPSLAALPVKGAKTATAAKSSTVATRKKTVPAKPAKPVKPKSKWLL